MATWKKVLTEAVDADYKNSSIEVGDVPTLTASKISDFDTEVGNHTAVTANTSKTSNATHTGNVTGATSLTIAQNVITGGMITTGGIDHPSKIANDVIGQAAIDANAVGASELYVSGNGTTAQFLRSDGDGTMTWATPATLSHAFSSHSGTVAVADGGTGVGSKTGTGSVVLNTNPSFSGTSNFPEGGLEVDGDPVITEGSDINDLSGTLLSNRMDADTAHLSGAQTFSGDKSFTGRVVITDSEPTLTVTNNTPSNTVVGIKLLSQGSTTFSVMAGGATKCHSLGVGTASSNTGGEIRATNEVTAFYSDDRLKNRYGNIENALDKVVSLNGFHYQPNKLAGELGYDTSAKKVGVSAQEVLKVLPEAVVPAPIDPQYHTVQYDKLIPLLIESIKELTAKVKRLENGNNK